MRDNEPVSDIPTNGDARLMADAWTDRNAVHRNILLAQRELREARGRVLEAKTGEEIVAVLSYLKRVFLYLDRAHESCTAWTCREAEVSSGHRVHKAR